jgi:GR25 family glycosyltransferase involved in LPS biosynthesis
MDAYVIYIKGKTSSENGVEHLIETISKHAPHVTLTLKAALNDKNEINDYLAENGISWDYPWSGSTMDFNSGLKKNAYPTHNKFSRISCSIMHHKIWKKIAAGNKPTLVFEHDAEFTTSFPKDFAKNSTAPIIGLNSPFGATRLPKKFHDVVQASSGDIVAAPTIDYEYIPQGLAGNSAYYITPKGAEHMIKLVNKHGVWPNDAIMCRQLVPNLSVSKRYYTKVQGLKSTTTY